MKHVIIGTAGHVDHGKTQLIKALTGINTDRLSEEQERGITIELGFAHLDFPDGTQAGIVDVPGHEKFIKNMLAGAGGIDLAILVVAADEGFMPQTIEHLDILTLLGIHDGLIALTKTDMVDPEWLEMMQEEIKDKVKGTFLEGKPIMPVSSVTGQGIPELRDELCLLVHNAAEKNTRIPFRLPVDRVFSVDGFGTVITGTLIEGEMKVGDSVELMPSEKESRVRNLQVHGADVDTAYAGQRVAVNLAGLSKSDVQRGDAVTKPGSTQVSRMLDVKLNCLSDSHRVILNDTQVHLYHSASVLLAKVVLLDRDKLNPGESCYAQLRMTESIASKNGDPFVIRFFSPLETIGGGTILDSAPLKHKRNVPAILESLKIRESGSGGDKVEQAIETFGTALPDEKKLAAKLGLDPDSLAQELQDLMNRGRVLQPLPGRYAAASSLDAAWNTCQTLLESYHKQNPLHAGMKSAELRQKLFKSTDQAVSDALLEELCREGKIKHIADRYALADFEVHFTKKQNAIKDRIMESYRKAGVEPPTVDEVMASLEPKEQADGKQVVDSLISGGELVLLSPQLCCHKDVYAAVCEKAKAHFADHETLTLAEMRDMLQTSRKFALAYLEYFDRNRITKKEGDFRKLNLGF